MKTQLHCCNSYLLFVRCCNLCFHSYYVGRGWIQGWGTFFNNAFNGYNFSIISNLFDNNNFYALYRNTEIENVRKNCIMPVFVKTSKLRAKNSNTICLKTCSRNTKIAIIKSKFLKIFLESMPSDPLKPLLSSVLNLLQTNSAGKSTLKNVKLWCPPKKILISQRPCHENVNFK